MATRSALTIEEFVGLLKNARQRGERWEACCPAHDDQRASLSVSMGEKGILAKCHAGCSYPEIVQALGLEQSQLFKPEPAGMNGNGRASKKKWGKIVATYDYTDAEGRLLYQAVRYDPKDFSQRRPDGEGGWIRDTKGVQRVLYRLPRVRAAVADKKPVIVVEGEKDVHALEQWKLCATTNVGGAGKWGTAYESVLVGAKVVIIPDNDDAGRSHAQIVAQSLHGKAQTIQIVDLPGLPERGDVSDWISAGGTWDQLTRLIREAPIWQSGVVEHFSGIVVNNRPLRDLTRDALQALERTNHPPRVFVRGGALTRWRHNEKGRPLIEVAAMSHVRGLLSRSADFFQIGKDGTRHVSPPDHVVADVLSIGFWPFPVLENITETPILRKDGTILATSGYDTATGLVYAPASGVEYPSVPTSPTRSEICVALSLLEEAIGEFPYQDEASKSNALALLLTPITRPAVVGPVPLALIDAPQQGTGKSLLSEVVTWIATGRPAPMMQAPKEDEEWRKALTAAFQNGETVMIYDNVDSRIAAPSLASAITAPVWRDRILGESRMVEFPICCTWMATGNNLQPDGDMPRRSYWIRLDAKVTQPWRRTGFKHPNLRDWVLQNRGRLIGALLTLGRGWFAAGCPSATVPLMGSFEEWTRVVGGVLAYAEVPGFLENLDAMYEQLDTTDQQWEAWLTEWYRLYGTEEKRIDEVLSHLLSGAPCPAVLNSAYTAFYQAVPDDVRFDTTVAEHLLKTRLGQWLKRKLGVRHGLEQYRLEYGAPDLTGKVKRWKVLKSGD